MLLIVFLIVGCRAATSSPLLSCTPSVQTVLLNSLAGTQLVLTFPKAYTAVPKIVPSISGFQATTNQTEYQLFIRPNDSSALSATGFIFNITVGTTLWSAVSACFLIIDSTGEQFALINSQQTAGINTISTTNGRDTFFLTMGAFNTSDNLLISAFNQGFWVASNSSFPDWYNPGYILDYGLSSTTAIWYSIEAVQNTNVSSLLISFMLIDTTITSSLIYRFERKFIYVSDVNTTQTPITPILYYDQYCFMAGINYFIFRANTTIQFNFTFPTFTLTSSSLKYSLNITTLNMYVATCVSPNIYYIPSTNLCYDLCPEPFYPSPPYCKPCHYTCKNCTTSAACATCLDPLGTTQTFAGDICNCNMGYFENGLGKCQPCNSSCLNCSKTENNCTACFSGFQVNSTYCVETCGDGKLFILACDDGNTASGDGCSSFCMIQQNFTCINGTTTAPSVCSYNQPFQLTFLSSSQGDSNIVNVSLQLFPQLPQFQTLNFSQYFSANIPYSSISHTYSNSILNFIINFTQPSNTYTELQLQFYPPTSSSNNFLWQKSSVYVPYGNEVILYYYSSFYLTGVIKIVLIIIEALAFLGLIILYRKAAALQFIMALQIVALSTSYIGSNHILITTFGYLHRIGINGYNKILDSITTSIPPQLDISRLGYSPELYQNLNLMLLINLTVIFLCLILYIIKTKVQSPHSDRLQTVYSYVMYEIVPTLVIFNLINLSFGVGETGFVYASIDSDALNPNHLGSNLAIFFITLLQFTVLCQYYRIDKQILISWRTHYKDTKPAQMHLVIWLFYKFITGFVMGLAHKYSNSLIALILLVASYIVYSIVLRPFRTALLLIQHLYSELVILYLFIILILYRSSAINELVAAGTIPAILLLVLLILGLLVLLAYAGYSLSKNIRYWTKKTPRRKIEHIESMDKMKEHYEEYNQLKRQSKYKIRRLHPHNRSDFSEATIENY